MLSLKLHPVSKIIGLSSVLAVGFLMVVLAAAVWGNWLPLVAAFIFAIAHVPTLLVGSASYTDITLGDFDEMSVKTDAADVAHFIESFLLATGFMMPLSLQHCRVFTRPACALTIVGGLLIYGTVVTFTTFFDGFGADDDDPFTM